MYHSTSTTLTACILAILSFGIVLISSVSPLSYALIFAALATTTATYGIHQLYK